MAIELDKAIDPCSAALGEQLRRSLPKNSMATSVSMAKRYMTAVIELPEDTVAAKAILQALPLFGEFHGGTVTAVYAGDAISENEIFEANADPMLIKAVRDQVAARH